VEPGMHLNCEVDDYQWPWAGETPVLMLHGFARNARFWNRWVPKVAGRRRVYRPEVRGCGFSDVPPDGYRFDSDVFVRDMLAVLDALELERVHWVGESSGGLIGFFFAAQHPERIASLVTCNSPGRIAKSIHQTYALDKSSSAEALRAYGTAEWCRRTLGYRLDVDNASPELQEWFVAEMGRTPAHVASELQDCFESVDAFPVMPKIQAPVLLMSGDRSKLSAEQQTAMRDAIPNATVSFYEGYGHGINVIVPERCADEAVRFWDSL
jgi:3-oxoadipate enol-lactonase